MKRYFFTIYRWQLWKRDASLSLSMTKYFWMTKHTLNEEYVRITKHTLSSWTKWRISASVKFNFLLVKRYFFTSYRWQLWKWDASLSLSMTKRLCIILKYSSMTKRTFRNFQSIDSKQFHYVVNITIVTLRITGFKTRSYKSKNSIFTNWKKCSFFLLINYIMFNHAKVKTS